MIDKILESSVTHAQNYGHEYVTIEHIALSLLDEEDIIKVFNSLEISTDNLRNDLQLYLEDYEFNNLSQKQVAQVILRKQWPLKEYFKEHSHKVSLMVETT